MILIASIAQSALLDLAFVFSGSVEGERRHKILKRLDREAVRTEILKEFDCEAARTAREAARWGGILV